MIVEASVDGRETERVGKQADYTRATDFHLSLKTDTLLPPNKSDERKVPAGAAVTQALASEYYFG